MIDKLSELLQPINWERCKTNYPVAASKLVRTLEETDKTTDKRQELRQGAQKARMAMLAIHTFLDGLSDEDRYTVFHWATVQVDHERLDHGAQDFREYLMALAAGVRMLEGEHKPPHGQTRHKPKQRAHSICAALALVHVVDLGEHPTYGKNGETGEPTGAFLKALGNVLEAKGIEVKDLSALAKGHCKDMKKRSIEELRKENRHMGASLFDLYVLRSGLNST